MKQYLNSDQTAKLIGLGFEKPKSIIDVWAHETDIDMEYEYECVYSIGELIELLPLSVDSGSDIVDKDYYMLTIRGTKVMYCDPYIDFILIEFSDNAELVDNLFDMVVFLKEEESI